MKVVSQTYFNILDIIDQEGHFLSNVLPITRIIYRNNLFEIFQELNPISQDFGKESIFNR